MFLFFLLLVVIFWLLVEPTSKPAKSFAIFYMFVLFGLNTDNADYYGYELFYKQADSFSGQYEYGFYILAHTFRQFGLPLQALYLFVAFVYLWALTFVTNKFCPKYAGYVFCFFLISNYFLNIVQMRFTLALVFGYIGYYYLISIENRKAAFVVYTLFIIAASMFHITSSFLLLFGFARSFSVKKTIFVTISVFVGLFFITVFLQNYFSDFYLFSRLDRLANQYSEESNSTAVLKSSIILMLTTGFYVYILNRIKLFISGSENITLEYIFIGKKICILLMCNIPLFRLGVEFDRVSTSMVFILLCIIGYYLRYLNKLHRKQIFWLTLFPSIIYLHFRTFTGGFNLAIGESFYGVFLRILNNNMILI